MKRDELDENAFGSFYGSGPDPYNSYSEDMFGKRYNHPGKGKRGPEHMWRSKESDHSKNDGPFIYMDIPLELPMYGF